VDSHTVGVHSPVTHAGSKLREDQLWMRREADLRFEAYASSDFPTCA